MQTISVSKALGGSVAVNSKVEVRSWVRTRRDSKAGISFLGPERKDLRLRAPWRRLHHLQDG